MALGVGFVFRQIFGMIQFFFNFRLCRYIPVIIFALFLFNAVWPGLPAEAGSTTPYLDFNDFPGTAPDEIPGSSASWIYTTARTNPNPAYYMTAYDSAGWRTQNHYPAPNGTIHDLFYRYASLAYNSPHMGFETYGYLEIDNNRAVIGKSLRYLVTGGKNSNTCPDGNSGGLPCNAHGLQVGCKEGYLDYINNGQDPMAQTPLVENEGVGHPYIYFSNTSQNSSPVPFVQAPGSNRLSLYVYLPGGVNNDAVDSSRPPDKTFTIGPYNGVGGHWYHHYTLQGGGWSHVVVDAHPQHNNAWSSEDKYPYPNFSLRDRGGAYFNTLHRWYLTAQPYEGVAWPPYSVWIDEIEYQLDDEPQNHETICSPSVMYRAETKGFEIGFMDKYKNCRLSYSTYEVRYSFSEIFNTNWDSATPVRIQADARFEIAARTDGKFQKVKTHYQNVWAPFKLASQDESLLVPGVKIYFAIKDISQVGGNGPFPVSSLDCEVNDCDSNIPPSCCVKGGRDYDGNPGEFDYAGDQPVLNLIKRIDYIVPKTDCCPDFLSDPVVIRDVTYPSGCNCEYLLQNPIEVGPGVLIESGATVTLKAPLVTLKSGVDVQPNAVFNCSD